MSERYELEELVIDDSFVNYCFRRQEADVARWEAYLRQYPDEAATMAAKAREMVLGISVMFWETQPVPVRKPFPLRRTLAVAASIAVIVLAGYWLLQPARQPVAVLAAKPEILLPCWPKKNSAPARQLDRDPATRALNCAWTAVLATGTAACT